MDGQCHTRLDASVVDNITLDRMSMWTVSQQTECLYERMLLRTECLYEGMQLQTKCQYGGHVTEDTMVAGWIMPQQSECLYEGQ